MRISRIVCLTASILCALPASATSFAVLLTPTSTGAECDVPVVPGTPSDSLRPTHMKVNGSVSWIIRPLRLTIDFDPVIPQGTRALPPQSFIFGMTVTDPASGEQITQLSGDGLSVCFNTPLSDVEAAKKCLGYLDETTKPPKWECQDSALAKDSGNYFCGKTDHLTIFAFAETAAVPEPASLASIGLFSFGALQRRRRT